MENNKYQGQTALITGASNGIGYELAKCFAKDGFNLVLVARTQEELEGVAKELTSQNNIRAYTIVADLMKRESAYHVYEQVQKEGLTIDILVNNAGQGIWGAFTGTDLNDELDIIELNVVSLVILTKLFLKEMVARDSGRVLNLASVASKAPHPYLCVYAATKAFVYHFTQGLINELKDSKVTMTALLPGPTDTDFFNKAGMEHTVAVMEGDLADPADVAKDGYEALMNGESRVISGFKNKIQVTMGNMMTDQMSAEQVRKQMEVSDEAFEDGIEEKHDHADHRSS